MLLKGLNHVATLTNDTERLHAFYRECSTPRSIATGPEAPGVRQLAGAPVGHPASVRYSELNVFQIEGNTEADRQTPMFGRGRIDHLALQAESLESFEEIRRRLMARGAADDFVTDFGSILSIFFRDPDGLECEVCVENPDARPGVSRPPGTRAARYS